MSRRAQENVMAVVLLLVFLGFLWMSFDYGPRARLVPVPIAAIGVVLVLLQLVWQNLRPDDNLQVNVLEFMTGHHDEPAAAKGGATGAGQEGDEPRPPGAELLRQLSAFAMVAVLLALFLTLGPVPSVFVFSAGYFILSGRWGWARSLGYAFACALAIYVMFGLVLDVDLNRGALAPFIIQYWEF